MFPSSNRDFLHVTPNALVRVAVVLYYFFLPLPTAANSLRQTPWLNGIGNRKVHNFRKPTRLFELRVSTGAKHETCGACVNVFAFLKRLQHYSVLGYMGQQSKFEL